MNTCSATNPRLFLALILASYATGSIAQQTGARALWAEVRDPSSILSQRAVHHQPDKKSEPSAGELSLIRAHARFLETNRAAKVLIQGHSPATGSREFSVAVGQRNADYVKRILIENGASEDQIESVSYGKERVENADPDPKLQYLHQRSQILYNGEF
jgi:peptidoglycan-associated lipoprotein